MANDKKFQVKNGLRTQNINFQDNPEATNIITTSMIDDLDALSISGDAGQLFSLTDDLTGSVFTVNDISGMPSIEVLANGNIALAEYEGKVGIGTSSPSSSVGFDAKLQLESANPMLVYKETDQSTKWEVGAWGGNYVVYNDTSERMRIDANGNVGIGANTPEKNLSIGNSQAEGIQFNFDNTNDYRNQILNYWNSGADSRMDFNVARISGATPSTIMSVGYNSNVGIGTTTPASTLDLTNGTDTAERAIRIQNDTVTLLTGVEGSDGNRFLGSAVGNAFFGTTGAHGLELGTNNNVRMVIDSAGYVGIGVASPNVARLQVKGTGTTVSTNSIFAENSAGAGLFAIRDNGDAFILGNVGIGTSGVANTRLAVTNSVVGANIETTSSNADHEALIVNRQNSDGIAIAINKAGSTVGSIGVSGDNNLYISGEVVSHSGLTFATNEILPSAVGAITDGAESLGSSSNRFKDLYLSGETIMNSRNAFKQGGGGQFKTIVISGGSENTLKGAATQAKSYLLAEIGFDFDNWAGNQGIFEVELHDEYYSSGIKKRYVISAGYLTDGTVKLVERVGQGLDLAKVRIVNTTNTGGGGANPKKCQVYVDVGPYATYAAVIRTTRTFGAAPVISGQVYLSTVSEMDVSNAANITFTADTTVELSTSANVTVPGNVGIGVSPTAKLDINISTNARGYFSSNIGEVGVGNFALQVADATGATLKPLGFRAEDIRFATQGGERMRIDSSGNVRVGTGATVITGLSNGPNLVVGDPNGGEIVAYKNTNAIADGDFVGAFLFGNDDNSGTEDHFAGMWAKSSGTQGSMSLHFTGGRSDYEAGTTHMTLDTLGKVGIGTASPSENLHIYSSSAAADVKLEATTAGQDSRLFIVRNGSTSRAYISFQDTVNNTGNWYAGLLRNTDDVFTIGRGDDFGTTSYLNIDTVGNVGIGVSPPSTQASYIRNVQIQGLQAYGHTGINDWGGFFTNSYIDASGLRKYISSSQYAHNLHFDNNGSFIFYNAPNTNLAGQTVPFAERFRIDASGKVGIGNSAPLGKLTISNAAGTNAPTTVTAANTYLQLGSDDYGPNNNGKFMIGFGYTDATNTNSPAYIGYEEATASGDTYGDLTFYTRSVATDTAPTERMRIDADGSVGIGTTSNESGYKLDVRGWGQFEHPSGDCVVAIRSGNDTGSSLLYFGDQSAINAASIVYNHTANNMTFNSNAGTTMTVSSGGNLVVAGNITAYGNPSDIRLKENIEVIPNAVDKVKTLDGITFNYIKDGADKRMTGVIAQQVQEVLPEAVYETETIEDPENKNLAVHYGNMVGLLIEAIKEQQQQIDELKSIIEGM